MGMFDEVICQVPLPDTQVVSDKRFQTKDMECLMCTYELRVDGTLWVLPYVYEGSEDTKPRQLTDLNRTIVFYNGIVTPEGYWKDYHATFVDGKLTSLTMTTADY